jgi:hypothetical protein
VFPHRDPVRRSARERFGQAAFLKNVDLREASLTDVTFASTKLTSLRLAQARLTKVDLTQASNLRIDDGIEALRGVTITIAQLIDLAPEFAASAGVIVQPWDVMEEDVTGDQIRPSADYDEVVSGDHRGRVARVGSISPCRRTTTRHSTRRAPSRPR